MSRHRQVAKQEVSYRVEQFSGPLPTPADFQAYDAALPGAAERLMQQFEEQSAHRRSIEGKVVDSNVANERRGLLSATWLMTLFVGGGVYLLATDTGGTAGFLALGYAALQTTLSFIANLLGRRRELKLKQGPEGRAPAPRS